VLKNLATAKNRLTEFVREVVSDPKVQPNHAWRHRFETLSRRIGLRNEITNMITGHVNEDTASEYGDYTIPDLAAAIARFPRIEL